MKEMEMEEIRLIRKEGEENICIKYLNVIKS